MNRSEILEAIKLKIEDAQIFKFVSRKFIDSKSLTSGQYPSCMIILSNESFENRLGIPSKIAMSVDLLIYNKVTNTNNTEDSALYELVDKTQDLFTSNAHPAFKPNLSIPNVSHCWITNVAYSHGQISNIEAALINLNLLVIDK